MFRTPDCGEKSRASFLESIRDYSSFMFEAVLLEFDGVIADTREARRTALLDALEANGVTLSATEYVEHCATLPVHGALRAAFALRDVPVDDTTVSLAVARAERTYATLVETGLSLAPGAQPLIASLRGQARLGVVSRSNRREIEHALGLAQIEDAFEFIIADDDPLAPKPSPAPYSAALERLAKRRPVAPKQVVALEDGSAGIRSAKAAGLSCIVVGYLPVHLAVEADAIVPSLVGQTLGSLAAIVRGGSAAER